jgi:RimJ/RimL family protein N-acetyltransferase
MPFDLQPILRGGRVLLRPQREDDLEALYAVAADPLLWAQHPQTTRWQRPVFEGIFREGMASGGALVVCDAVTHAVIGGSRYYDVDEGARSLAIGFTFIARSLGVPGVNDEMKRLMLDHAFTWASTVWFYVGVDNLRSRRAVEKLGAVYSHDALRGTGTMHAFYRLDAPR